MVNARAVNSLRGKVIAMLSLLGLLGALFATLSADVLLPANRTEPEEDAEPSDADSGNGTDMLMLLGESSTEEAQPDDDPAGMPLSDDVPDAVDDNVTLIGDEAANRLSTGSNGEHPVASVTPRREWRAGSRLDTHCGRRLDLDAGENIGSARGSWSDDRRREVVGDWRS